MIKAFIFDIDGTLVDTAQLHINSWIRAFKEFGLDIPSDKIQSQIGRRATEIAEAIVPKNKQDEVASIVEKKRLVFREYYPKIKPFPMVKELFELLNKNGIKLALATSTTRRDAEFYTEILSIENLVGATITAEDIEHSKPNPEIFLKAARRLEIDPGESVCVGDSPHDMAAAKNAGMLAIGVLTGGYTRKELQETGADEIYRNIGDLYKNFSLKHLTNLQF